MPARLVFVALGLILLFAPAPAFAQSDVAERPESPAPPRVIEARERVSRGEALFARGDYDAALTEFETAYEVIGEHPSRHLVLYNIGQCHEREFRYDVAADYYRRYLREGGPIADDAEVQAQIETLESLLATVDVDTNVAAEVWVADRTVGSAPGPVRIPAGLQVLELRAEGYLPARRSIQVAAGRDAYVEVRLERLSEEFEGLHPAFFLTSAGLAAAALAVGAGLGLTAVSDRNTLSERLDDPVDRWNVTQGDIDSVGDLALAADIAFAGAALFGVGATVLALLTNWGGDEEAEPGAALEVGWVRGGAVALFSGSLSEP